jgi:proteasome lid subunit RPN8/RPN11
MITMARQLLDHIEAAARRAYPSEACGFLIGHQEGETVHADCFALSPNRAEDARRHFALDPAMHIRLQRELRGSPFAIVGLFHSHPNGSTAMSRADLRSPAPEQWVWLVLALAAKEGPVESAAFRCHRDGEPSALEIKTL